VIGVPRNINGERIFFPPRVSRYFPRLYEVGKWEFIEAYCRGISLDLGAHIGLFTVKMSKISQIVVAAEPTYDSFSYLTATLRLNKVFNVVALNSCVSDHDGIIDFCETDNTASCLNSTSSIARATVTKKKSFTIDSLRIPFDFIKIDIEGGELRALKGAQETLANTRAICLEVHPAQLKLEDSTNMDIHQVLYPYSPKYFIDGKVITSKCFIEHPEQCEFQILLGD